jgi:hypothetical protein
MIEVAGERFKNPEALVSRARELVTRGNGRALSPDEQVLVGAAWPYVAESFERIDQDFVRLGKAARRFHQPPPPPETPQRETPFCALIPEAEAALDRARTEREGHAKRLDEAEGRFLSAAGRHRAQSGSQPESRAEMLSWAATLTNADTELRSAKAELGEARTAWLAGDDAVQVALRHRNSLHLSRDQWRRAAEINAIAARAEELEALRPRRRYANQTSERA